MEQERGEHQPLARRGDREFPSAITDLKRSQHTEFQLDPPGNSSRRRSQRRANEPLTVGCKISRAGESSRAPFRQSRC